MNKFIKILLGKKGSNNFADKAATPKDVRQTTNAVFDQYKKSFKDLAQYDREGKVPAN